MTTVQVPVSEQSLAGDLEIPPAARGIVVFAHGSGSSRFSSRNQFIARSLVRDGLATLLIDLLTAEEGATDQQTSAYRFNIPLLARRLITIIDWLATRSNTTALPIGLFGASTGAGAALIAAARRQQQVSAVVSRGGRPDLAGASLTGVLAPTLLIVGGLDTTVLHMNREAMGHIRGEVRLEIVAGATHLFEEPGALEQVAFLSGQWFVRHLRAAPMTSPTKA